MVKLEGKYLGAGGSGTHMLEFSKCTMQVNLETQINGKQRIPEKGGKAHFFK